MGRKHPYKVNIIGNDEIFKLDISLRSRKTAFYAVLVDLSGARSSNKRKHCSEKLKLVLRKLTFLRAILRMRKWKIS
jgi:hypothetical protein